MEIAENLHILWGWMCCDFLKVLFYFIQFCSNPGGSEFWRESGSGKIHSILDFFTTQGQGLGAVHTLCQPILEVFRLSCFNFVVF